MSGVLRRGSLTFDCNMNNKNAKSGKSGSRGSHDEFRSSMPSTPEISVITLDFRRLSDDLKKNGDTSEPTTRVQPSNQTFEFSRDLSQDVDSDEISNVMGHYGNWQLIWAFVLSLFQLPATFHMFVFVFQTISKDFWCEIPEDENFDYQNVTKNACTIPVSTVNLNQTFNSTVKCTNFRFADDGSGTKTLIEEYGLVCDRQHFLSVVETCFLAGAAVSSVCSGWISDRYGRKHTLMTFALIEGIFGLILAFSSSLAMYMTLRVIIGFASMTLAVVSLVLVVELVSGKCRTIIGILNILPVALSYVLMAGIAYFIRDWRTLQLVISLPGLALLSIWYWAPESPRWLLSRGRLPELYVIMERAAKFNGRQLPSNYQKILEAAAPNPVPTPITTPTNLDTNSTSIVENTTQSLATNEKITSNNSQTNPLFVVFNKQYWRTTCLNLIVWLTLIMLYFGLTLHLGNLGGDIYMNTAIAGSVECISIVLSIFVVLKVGLRYSLIAFMLIPGVCCLATNVIPMGDSNLYGVIALAMIAKCVIGANNAIIPTYTASQYPTEARNFGVGMGNLAAGIALIMVPYLWLLEHVTPLLPLTILGACGLVGAIALYLMKDPHRS